MNEPAGLVSESTWTDGAWPFTVDAGVLMCASGRVTFAADLTMYALNGPASSADGFEDVDAIWKDSTHPGVRIDLGPMIQRGLSLQRS